MVSSTQETGVDAMNDLSKPTFPTWKRENLDSFVSELWDAYMQLQDRSEQLRLDLKDAMKELRKYQDDWK
jgi:hypothetical protein